MKMDWKSGGGTVEILADFTHHSIPITVAAPSVTDGTVVKAGTPLKKDGSSTTGADAVGILLYDVDTAEDPNGAAVVSAIIDAKKAQAHSGVTYAMDALKIALPGITFRDNIGAADEEEG